MSYDVARADLAHDSVALASLWARTLGGTGDDRIRWLYGDAETGQCWVLRTSGGEVVGSTGLAARRLRVGGQEVLVGQAVDLAVDRDHRTLGPAIKLQRALLADLGSLGVAIAYAFPNRMSEPILARVGYRRVGAMTRWVKPLRAEHALRRRLSGGACGTAFWLPVTALMRAVSWETWVRLPRGTSVEHAEGFDGRFDAFFEGASRQFALVGDRSADYLAWRFQRNPTRQYRILTVSDGDGRLRGYAVYREDRGVARVADLLADGPDAWEWLLTALLRCARRARLGAVAFLHFGSDAVRSVMRRCGFRDRGPDTSVFVHGAGEDGLPLPSGWHLTEADRDV